MSTDRLVAGRTLDVGGVLVVSTSDDLRRLDMEIARQVFGIKRLYLSNGEPWESGEGDDFPQYIPSGKPWRTHQIDAVTLPWFSRDISAAWQIVERFWGVELVKCDGTIPTWSASICGRDGSMFSACAETAPGAICRAAVQACQADSTR